MCYLVHHLERGPVDVRVLGRRPGHRRARRASRTSGCRRRSTSADKVQVPPRLRLPGGGREEDDRRPVHPQRRDLQGGRLSGVQQGQRGRQAAPRAAGHAGEPSLTFDPRRDRRAPGRRYPTSRRSPASSREHVLDAALARQPARERWGIPNIGLKKAREKLRRSTARSCTSRRAAPSARCARRRRRRSASTSQARASAARRAAGGRPRRRRAGDARRGCARRTS